MKLNWFCDLEPSTAPAARYTRAVVGALAERAEVVVWTPAHRPHADLDGVADVRLVDADDVPWAEINRAVVSFHVLGSGAGAANPLLALASLHAGVVVLPPGIDGRTLFGLGTGEGTHEPLRRALGVVVHDRTAIPVAVSQWPAPVAIASADPLVSYGDESRRPDEVRRYAADLIRFALGSRHHRVTLALDALAERSGGALTSWGIGNGGDTALRPVAERILGLVHLPPTP